jgi:hypothetical protein
MSWTVAVARGMDGSNVVFGFIKYFAFLGDLLKEDILNRQAFSQFLRTMN